MNIRSLTKKLKEKYTFVGGEQHGYIKVGKLVEAIIKSKSGTPCNILYGDKELAFKTKKGTSYRITVENGALKSEKVK